MLGGSEGFEVKEKVEAPPVLMKPFRTKEKEENKLRIKLLQGIISIVCHSGTTNLIAVLGCGMIMTL